MKSKQRIVITFLLSFGVLSVTRPGFAQNTGATQPTTPAQPTAAPATTPPATTPPATTPPATTPPPATAPATDDDGGFFSKGEWNLSPFGAYVDQAGGKWAGGLAGTYFFRKNIGIGAATYWTESRGSFFDNLEAEGYFRLPVFKRMAPYAVGSLGYDFNREYSFETLGAGIDFRALRRFDAFTDVQYRFSNDSDKSDSGAFIRFGLRFTL